MTPSNDSTTQRYSLNVAMRYKETTKYEQILPILLTDINNRRWNQSIPLKAKNIYSIHILCTVYLVIIVHYIYYVL